jgi:hypothetical protein
LTVNEERKEGIVRVDEVEEAKRWDGRDCPERVAIAPFGVKEIGEDVVKIQGDSERIGICGPADCSEIILWLYIKLCVKEYFDEGVVVGRYGDF